MKIIQIAASSKEVVALTDKGQLFSIRINSSRWNEFPPLPGSDESEAQEAYEEIQAEKKSRALDAQREIDLASLPPKLAKMVAIEDGTKFCPDCGMSWNGVNCQECNI